MPPNVLAPTSTCVVALLVEPEDQTRTAIRWFLASFGSLVQIARSGEEALSIFTPGSHRLVILGSRLPGISATETALIIKYRSPNTRVLVYGVDRPLDCPGVDLVLTGPVQLVQLKSAADALLNLGPRRRAASNSEQFGTKHFPTDPEVSQ